MTSNYNFLDLDRVPFDQLVPRSQIPKEWKHGNSFIPRIHSIGPVSIDRAKELLSRGFMLLRIHYNYGRTIEVINLSDPNMRIRSNAAPEVGTSFVEPETPPEAG